jgi:hypothetical protein
MWLIGGITAAVAVLIAVMAVVRGAEPAGASACRSTLIPAYLPPDGIDRIAERPVRSRVVIVNPSNGPGAAAQPAYRAAIGRVQETGTRVLGYVHTGYGSRPPGEVEADIERYRSWYGVDGIFLDETAHTDGALAYYRAVASAVRAADGGIVAMNPGVVPARAYFDVADVVVTFEGAYADYATALGRMPAWVRRLPPGRTAHLVYGASAAEARTAIAQSGAAYVYVTSGSLPDPWSALPSYLDDEEAQLAACP